MLRNLSPAHIIIVVVVLVVLFGWKRLPDMARSLGRSARVFKSEVEEMKKDGKSSSDASGSTVPGDVVNSTTGPSEQERLAAEARVAAEAQVAEAEAKAAQARAEVERLRGESAR